MVILHSPLQRSYLKKKLKINNETNIKDTNKTCFHKLSILLNLLNTICLSKASLF